MPIDSVELVAEALRVCGNSRGALARRLGVGSYGEDKIGRWLRGEGKPRYDQTIELLEVVGWLNKDAGHLSDRVDRADPLEELARGVASLERAQAEILAEVRTARAEREAARSPQRGRPKRKTIG